MKYLRIALLLSVALMSSGFRFRCWFFCDDQTGIQNDYTGQRDECRKYAENQMNITSDNAAAALDDKARKAQLVSYFGACMNQHGWTVPTDKKDIAAAAAPAPALDSEGAYVASEQQPAQALAAAPPQAAMAPATPLLAAPAAPPVAPVLALAPVPAPVPTAQAVPYVAVDVAPNPPPGQVLTAPPRAAAAAQEAYRKRMSDCAYARYSASTSNNAAAAAQACDAECATQLKGAPSGFHPAACPAP